MSGPELSRVVRENIEALAQREVNGTAEHGDNMDRTDYTAQKWAAELNSEHLDAANYSRKLMHMLPRLEAAAAMLERLGLAWSGQAWQQVAAPSADQDPIRTQVQAALDSLAQAAIYPADGEFAKTCLQHALVLINAGYCVKGGSVAPAADHIDMDNGLRHFPWTYTNQPGNLGASALGACARLARPGGDSIDHGLSLLRELHVRGFGIVRVEKLAASTEVAS